MALNDVAIRNAKPMAKPYKLGDGGGLYLLVTPAGGKLWRVKFRVVGKEKLLSLGSGLVDQSQKMTVAARAMAEKKTVGHRS
jgi:hypothetical protein